ncbi:hypothetical protein ABPG75_003563 [Micractinium tetrahymenae]
MRSSLHKRGGSWQCWQRQCHAVACCGITLLRPPPSVIVPPSLCALVHACPFVRLLSSRKSGVEVTFECMRGAAHPLRGQVQAAVATAAAAAAAAVACCSRPQHQASAAGTGNEHFELARRGSCASCCNALPSLVPELLCPERDSWQASEARSKEGEHCPASILGIGDG